MRPSAVRVHTWQGEAAVTLTAGDFETTFLPGLGMLGVSLTHLGEALVALPASLDEYRGGATTGIPLMHPWANRLAQRRFTVAGRTVDLTRRTVPTDDNGLPMHGCIQGRPFSVERLGCSGTHAALGASLDLAAHPDLLARFPFPHRLEVVVRLGPAGLRVSTVLRPTGDDAVPAAFGWHPYLRLPRSAASTWILRLPALRRVPLDERLLPSGAPEARAGRHGPLGRQTFDDLYRLGPDRRFEVTDRRRRMVLRIGRGYGYAQIYRPANGGFICIEPMVAAGNALVDGTAPMVAPGTTLRASWALGVSPA